MNINIFFNRQDPNNLKFFLAPASLLMWIKNIDAHGDKWKQEFDDEISKELSEMGFVGVEPLEVTYFNYENEILNSLLAKAPEQFTSMSEAWLFAEKVGYKIIKTVAFVD